MMTLETLLENMWVDYCKLNPAAKRIYDIFTAEGETVLNDHIALRTFNHPRLGIESLAKHFKKFGYTEKGEYTFVDKKLYAKHYEHPNDSMPKIFISELELEKVSPFIRETVNHLVEQISDSTINDKTFPMCGRPWKPSTCQARAACR